MACRRVAARQHGRAQMADPLETFSKAAHEPLATPDRPVISESRAVERHADDARLPGFALGEHAGHVRAMVLHG